MRRIPLHARGGSVRAFALVDDEDFARFGHLRWSLHSGGYAYRWEPGSPRRCVLLHRAILGLEAGDRRQGDHRNRDRLDCRRGNLRVTTNAGNAQNVPSRGRSRFRNVSWHKGTGSWQVKLEVDGEQIHGGLFDDELEAALVAEGKRYELMPFAEPDPALVAALASGRLAA